MKIAVALMSTLITLSPLSAMDKQEKPNTKPTGISHHSDRWDSDDLDGERLGKSDAIPASNSGQIRIIDSQSKPETPAPQQQVPGAGKCGLFRIIDDQN